MFDRRQKHDYPRMKELVTKCRDMWQIIADNNCDKWDALDIMGVPIAERPIMDCYCCEYTSDGAYTYCDLCPLWGDSEPCYVDGKVYSQWRMQGSVEKARLCALTIVRMCEEVLQQPELTACEQKTS